MVLLYLATAIVLVGLGAGVLLFERFVTASRRFFALTFIAAAWMVPLGLTHGAGTEAVERFWFRLAYLAIPLTVPAVSLTSSWLNGVEESPAARLEMHEMPTTRSPM